MEISSGLDEIKQESFERVTKYIIKKKSTRKLKINENFNKV